MCVCELSIEQCYITVNASMDVVEHSLAGALHACNRLYCCLFLDFTGSTVLCPIKTERISCNKAISLSLLSD